MALGIGAGGDTAGGISSDIVIYVKNFTLGAHGVSDGTMSSVTFPKSCEGKFLKSIRATVVEAAGSWPSSGVIGYLGLGTTNYNINLGAMQINYPPSISAIPITSDKTAVGSTIEKEFTGTSTSFKIWYNRGRNAVIGGLEGTSDRFLTVDLEVTLRDS